MKYLDMTLLNNFHADNPYSLDTHSHHLKVEYIVDIWNVFLRCYNFLGKYSKLPMKPIDHFWCKVLLIIAEFINWVNSNHG